MASRTHSSWRTAQSIAATTAIGLVTAGCAAVGGDANPDRHELARLVRDRSRTLADSLAVEDDRAVALRVVQRPYLRHGRLCVGETYGGSHTLPFAIGLVGSDADLLSDAQSFLAFSQRAGVNFSVESNRVEYSRDYVALTEEMDGVWVVQSVSDVEARWIDSRRSELEAFKKEYRHVIRPPTATPDDSWRIRLFGIHEGGLFRFDVQLSRDGAIHIERELLGGAHVRFHSFLDVLPQTN